MSAKKTVSFADDIEVSGAAGNPEFIEEHREFLRRIAEKNGATVDDGPSHSRRRTSDDDDPLPKIPRLDDEDDYVDKKKHTLDSDEEEDEDHKRMDMHRVEGQEDETVDFDGNIKITPFNMKDDEEDGHFDESGNFIFEKKTEIRDGWLDNIDWAYAKKNAGKNWDQIQKDDIEDIPPPLDDDRRKVILAALLNLLTPDQTITNALSEISKAKKLTPAEERKLRWAAKKAGKPVELGDSANKTAELSSLADELISAGHMDAYEWSRERVAHMLKQMNTVSEAKEYDMFGDEPVPGASASAQNDGAVLMEDAIKWEYKDAKIQGPFTSQEMADKQEAGNLAAKGLARKLGSADFNPVARIDFEIYC